MSWADIQHKVFVAWCNEHLRDRGMHVNDLRDDFRDGIKLINLLEIISSKSLGKYNKNPRVPTQRYENTNTAVAFVQNEGIKLVNVGGTDITDGNFRIIMGFIWSLILRYQINKGGGTGGKDDLLLWVQSKIPEYNITGFKGKDWNSGKALVALTNAVGPGLYPDHQSLDENDKLGNLEKGMALANDRLNIPRVMEPKDMAHSKVDEQSVMTYISYFRNAQLQDKPNYADQCYAFGPGLVQGVVGDPAAFTVETPLNCGKLEIKVDGPADAATVKVTQDKSSTSRADSYAIVYEPKTPGDYKISVTLDGVHIPGSVFTVKILAAVSLGGEGKIRVFYSTTTANETYRKEKRLLQDLLERRKIHLRPDFEPWIAVDIMEKPDREAVFIKAGTKVLPIVFIDDVYIGAYPKMQDLDESGELDKLLPAKS